jgi:hypothetical protein
MPIIKPRSLAAIALGAALLIAPSVAIGGADERGHIAVRAGISGSPDRLHIGATTAAAKQTLYGGSTRDDEPIVLRADARGAKLKSAAFTFTVACPSGNALPVSLNVPVRPDPPGAGSPVGVLVAERNSRGRFKTSLLAPISAKPPYALTLSVLFEGKLKKKSASGTLTGGLAVSNSQTGAPIETCGMGPVKWTAKHAPGRVFAGVTGMDMPVVLAVNAKRTKITELRFGWYTTDCTPAGSFVRFGDLLNDFRLRKGKFDDAFADDFRRDDGGTNRFEYDLNGKVSRTKASGAFAINYTETNPDGSELVCRVPATNWKAASR